MSAQFAGARWPDVKGFVQTLGCLTGVQYSRLVHVDRLSWCGTGTTRPIISFRITSINAQQGRGWMGILSPHLQA